MDEDERNELQYRRKKQWDIFSWSGSLLVAITGGVIALKTRDTVNGPLELSGWHRGTLSVVVIALGVYSVCWISYNWDREKEIKPQAPPPFVGYDKTLIGLILCALAAILF